MKILFTGASSFTGMWFAEELAENGYDVIAAFPRKFQDYCDLKKERVNRVLKKCRSLFSCPFGSSSFLEAIKKEEKWDLLCHHAADVYDYKNPDFDFLKALANNTKNLKTSLLALKNAGCRKILLTGSVFEQGEGEGSDSLRAVSAYGLSKGLTYEVFKYFSQILEMDLAKFVIPNPFGPFEEPRFTTYLIRSWLGGKTPEVSCPEYIRDNIPISLLAKSYKHFANTLFNYRGNRKLNPSFYVGNQGDFALKFAKEMGKRLSIPCNIELLKQTEFNEPLIRINSDPLDAKSLNWDEEKAWDALSDYYRLKAL